MTLPWKSGRSIPAVLYLSEATEVAQVHREGTETLPLDGGTSDLAGWDRYLWGHLWKIQSAIWLTWPFASTYLFSIISFSSLPLTLHFPYWSSACFVLSSLNMTDLLMPLYMLLLMLVSSSLSLLTLVETFSCFKSKFKYSISVKPSCPSPKKVNYLLP